MLIFPAGKEKPLKCPPGFTLSDSFCFHLDRSLGKFNQKAANCSALGGIIIKVDSHEKNSAVTKFVQNETANISQKFYAYLGLKDMVGDNNLSNYRWVSDNSPMTYSYFANNEPGNTFERCVMFGRAFKWADISCGKDLWAICEADVIDESQLP